MGKIQLKIGTLIDRLYKAEQDIAEANREKARIEQEIRRRKAKRAKIANEIQDRFKKDQIDGAEGKLARVRLKKVTAPTLRNWAKLAAYVIKNKAPELFQRRISKEAWLDHLEKRKGRPVPGIETYEEIRLSVTKKG